MAISICQSVFLYVYLSVASVVQQVVWPSQKVSQMFPHPRENLSHCYPPLTPHEIQQRLLRSYSNRHQGCHICFLAVKNLLRHEKFPSHGMYACGGGFLMASLRMHTTHHTCFTLLHLLCIASYFQLCCILLSYLFILTCFAVLCVFFILAASLDWLCVFLSSVQISYVAVNFNLLRIVSTWCIHSIK